MVGPSLPVPLLPPSVPPGWSIKASCNVPSFSSVVLNNAPLLHPQQQPVASSSSSIVRLVVVVVDVVVVVVYQIYYRVSGERRVGVCWLIVLLTPFPSVSYRISCLVLLILLLLLPPYRRRVSVLFTLPRSVVSVGKLVIVTVTHLFLWVTVLSSSSSSFFIIVSLLLLSTYSSHSREKRELTFNTHSDSHTHIHS